MNLRLSLHKIYKNKGFQWPIFSDFALIRENTGQWKPVFWHILYSVWNKILIIFADDTKVIRQITTKEDFIVEDMERTLQLQSEINIIAGMVSKMASYISPKKNVLSWSWVNNITYTERYTLHRQELEHVFEQKGLGAIFDAELKFDKHNSVKVKKGNAMFGLFWKSFLHSVQKIIHCLHKTTSLVWTVIWARFVKTFLLVYSVLIIHVYEGDVLGDASSIIRPFFLSFFSCFFFLKSH